MEGLSIREAAAADLDATAALLDEISDLHVAALPEYFRPMDNLASAQWMLGQVAESPKVVVLVAEDDGQVVGLVHFSEREAEYHPTLAPRRFLKLSTLVVAATHRQRGIGRALMRHAREWGVARGLSEAELNVYEFNGAAIGLYEGLGYETRMRRMVLKLVRLEGTK